MGAVLIVVGLKIQQLFLQVDSSGRSPAIVKLSVTEIALDPTGNLCSFVCNGDINLLPYIGKHPHKSINREFLIPALNGIV